MEVVVDEGGRIRLDDPEDFRNFQVTLAGEVAYEVLETAIGTIGHLEGPDAAWIRQDALRKLGRDDSVWQEKLSAMIAFAARHGWTDPGTGEVRAHIVGSGGR